MSHLEDLMSNELHQQAEQDRLTAAYAEGRNDEREEWLPVLEALKEFVHDMASGSLTETERIAKARAAIASVEGKS